MVVIAIIGLLSSIILAALATTRDKARTARAQEEIHNIYNAMEIYYLGHGTLSNGDYCSACHQPPTFAHVCDATQWSLAIQPLIAAGLLPQSSLKDPWGNPWCFDNNYNQCDATIPTVLFSMGPNGIEDTDWGPASNWNQKFLADDTGIVIEQPTNPSGPNLCPYTG
jgi:type II secretory pathway pseudopilin PulG